MFYRLRLVDGRVNTRVKMGYLHKKNTGMLLITNIYTERVFVQKVS